MYRLMLFSLFIIAGDCAVEFSDRSRNFSIELVHYTAAEVGGHVVISPFGIWSLMTGVALGATGESYEQLRRAFILPKNDATLINGYKNLTNIVLETKTSEVSITSKNFMFLDNDFTIKPDFKNLMARNFKADIKVLNFKEPNLAAKTANDFIENSGGRVSNVLTSDDFMEARMILTNVISFKGLWGLPFNKTDTIVEPFTDDQGKVIGNVNMMYQRAQFAYSYMKPLQGVALEMPYGSDGRYSMLILLPFPGVRVKDMYKNLQTITLKDIYAQLVKDTEQYGSEEIEVKVPRFKISTNVVLNRPLNAMGVYDIFDPKYASFNLVSDESLFISAIVHKADIEVTESGTVASASTSAYFADRISPPKFYVNKPFAYFVVEKTTATVIFGGMYTKPSVF